MSDSVVVAPRLTRTAPRAMAGSTPMAASTCDGWTFPDEQAAPEDTETPSRSKAMMAVSAFAPGRAKSVVLGSRSAPTPTMTAAGVAVRSPASSPSRSSPMRAASASRVRRAAEAAAPNPAIAATFSVPARAPRFLPAAAEQRIETDRRVALDQRAHALWGADLVPRKGQKVAAEP